MCIGFDYEGFDYDGFDYNGAEAKGSKGTFKQRQNSFFWFKGRNIATFNNFFLTTCIFGNHLLAAKKLFKYFTCVTATFIPDLDQRILTLNPFHIIKRTFVEMPLFQNNLFSLVNQLGKIPKNHRNSNLSCNQAY